MKTIKAIFFSLTMCTLLFATVKADYSHCINGYNACMQTVEDNYNADPSYDFIAGMQGCNSGLSACLNPDIK